MDRIESFGIYGKALPEFDPGSLHCERLEDQLPFHGWAASPHRHEGLDQFLLFVAGSGRLVLETERHDFAAPMLMFMPAGSVHGFDSFSRDVSAPIITVSQGFMDMALVGLDAGLLLATRQPRLIPLHGDARADEDLRAAFGIVAREYAADAPGRQEVMAACLRLIVTAMGRMVAGQVLDPQARGAQIALFSGFRTLLEQEFRQQPKVADLAARLGTSTGRLNAVCQAVTGKSPQKLLHERLATEAKRMLLYTTHPATTLSYMLGFREPAYFSRFFRRAVGMPPGAFRAMLRRPHGDGPPPGGP